MSKMWAYAGVTLLCGERGGRTGRRLVVLVKPGVEILSQCRLALLAEYLTGARDEG